MVVMLEVVEVADKYRITITRSVREVVPLKVGQKVAIVPFGDKILVQPLPENPEETLSELAKEIVFNKEACKTASKYLLSQSK
jgi:bifunctional DNA-binding transcriptional regulator/antitoxin component of YhaV-PrlF toxin-antitoxin module